jgi:nicotinamide riboside transporter PnuC
LFAKGSTRYGDPSHAANASPEPFSNWFLSLAEDVFVIGLSAITLKYPVLALAVSVVIVILIVMTARTVWKWLRRREPSVISK